MLLKKSAAMAAKKSNNTDSLEIPHQGETPSSERDTEKRHESPTLLGGPDHLTFRPNTAIKLSPEQSAAAVPRPGTSITFATAGAGKTATTSFRIAELWHRLGRDPSDIRGISFTNASADELAERVDSIAGEATGIGISTMHRFCLDLIMRAPNLFGYSGTPKVIDADESGGLLKQVVLEVTGFAQVKDLSEFKIQDVKRWMSELDVRSYSDDPRDRDPGIAHLESPPVPAITKACILYRQKLRAYDFIDFDTLLIDVLKGLQESRKRAESSGLLTPRFGASGGRVPSAAHPSMNSSWDPFYDLLPGHLFVDEAQDLNAVQWLIVEEMRLRGTSLSIVGDDDQCHPCETLITMRSGVAKRIEDIKERDIVLSFDAEQGTKTTQERITRVIDETSARPYRGDMYRFVVGGKTVDATPNHRWVTRINNNSDKRFAVFVSVRGESFSIDFCEMEKGAGCGIGAFNTAQNNDMAWILKVFTSKVYAAEYAIILNCQVRSWSKSNTAKLMIANGDAGLQRAENMQPCKPIDLSLAMLLVKYGKLFDYPIWRKGDKEHPGGVFCTQSVNLIEDLHELPVFREGCSDLKEGIYWSSVFSASRYFYTGEVYSLNVAAESDIKKLYVANGVVTHNSIYSWNGARPFRFRMVADNADHKHLLPANRRCGKNIVALAREIIEGIPDTRRQAKGLEATRNEEGVVKVSTIGTLRDHIGLAVRKIKDTVENSITVEGTQVGRKTYNDFAFIVRSTTTTFPVIEGVLRAAGVPYRVCGGRSALEMPEAKFLRALGTVATTVSARGDQDAEPKESPLHWNAIMGEIGVTAQAIANIESRSLAMGGGLGALEWAIKESRISPQSKRAIEIAIRGVRDIRGIAKSRGASALDIGRRVSLREIFEQQDLRDTLERVCADRARGNITARGKSEGKTPSGRSLEDAIREEFNERMGQVEDSHGALFDLSVSEALSSLSLASDKTKTKDEPMVTITTTHSAKGLEWDTCFIVDVCDQAWPAPNAFRQLAGTQSENHSVDILDEERRLLYVAVTRAKNVCYLVTPAYVMSRDRSMEMAKPSRFLPSWLRDMMREEMDYVARQLENGNPNPCRGLQLRKDENGSWTRKK